MNRVACVCLTTYPARAPMFADALRAYDAQVYSSRRLIVVNDGSPVRSARFDVTAVNLRRRTSIGDKRQIGLDLVRDEWVATWDDDDFCMPDHLGVLVACAARAGARYVRSGTYALADQDLRVGGIVRRPCYASALLWAPSAKRVGGYADCQYAEDWAIYTRMLLGGEPVAACDATTYVHRRHLGNVTSGHEDAPWGLNTQLREALEDQRRWPDPRIAALQARLDALRSERRPELVVPA